MCDWCRREEDILADKLSDHSSFDDIAAGEDIGEPLLKPKRHSFARRLLSFVTEETSDVLAEQNIGRKQTGPTWSDLDDEGAGVAVLGARPNGGPSGGGTLVDVTGVGFVDRGNILCHFGASPEAILLGVKRFACGGGGSSCSAARRTSASSRRPT